MIVEDSKLEIYVDGKNIYNGATVEYTEEPDKLTISTEIGKQQKQKLKIIVTKMNYVDPVEETTDKKEE
jgi:hypothetical protein